MLLKDNPEATGFPEQALGEFARELSGGEAEVSGYRSFTCKFTCYLTLPNDL